MFFLKLMLTKLVIRYFQLWEIWGNPVWGRTRRVSRRRMDGGRGGELWSPMTVLSFTGLYSAMSIYSFDDLHFFDDDDDDDIFR